MASSSAPYTHTRYSGLRARGESGAGKGGGGGSGGVWAGRVGGEFVFMDFEGPHQAHEYKRMCTSGATNHSEDLPPLAAEPAR